MFRQRLRHQTENRGQALVDLKDFPTFLGNMGQPLGIETIEDRQRLHKTANALQFGIADTAINVGVGLLLIGTFVLRHGEDEASDASAVDAEMSVGDGGLEEDGDDRDG